jgi:hypothetical protein
MIHALYLCCFNLFFCNYQSVELTIDIPKEIQNEEIVVLSGTIYNGSAKNVAFWDIALFKSLYRGDTNWNIIIFKDGQQYFIPMAFFGKRSPPKVIKLKKGKKYLFEFSVSLKELSTDGLFSLDSIESGNYEIQLIVSLKTPKNVAIKSNTVKCYLNVKE